jgi:site-specific recombinase XerD
MAVRPKGSGYMADFMVGGSRYREFGFKTEAEAGSWELSARAALMLGKPLPSPSHDGKTPKGEKVLDDILKHCSDVHWASKKSARSLVRSARLYVAHTGPKVSLIDGLSTASVAAYVSHLRSSGRSGGTINRHLSGVSVMAKHAVSLGWLQAPPMLPWQKEGQGRLRFFTRSEEDLILTTLHLWGQARVRALFIFLVDTGCRLGEALAFDPTKDLSKDGRVTFWETKNGQPRTVPLTKRAREAAAAGFRDLDVWRLQALWNRLRTHHEWIGDAVIHTFRHTCASRLVEAGVDLLRVKEWMGHKTLVTTMRYAHLSPKKFDGMAEILEKSA